MTSIQAVGLYTGIHLILLMLFSYNVGRFRMSLKINLGDGGDENMQRATRAQANYVEYTPFVLIGLFVISSLGIPALWIHIVGGLYTLVRVMHFAELGLNKMPKGRFYCTVGTMLTLLILGLMLIVHSFYP